jgi:hypothetical protein
MNILPTEFRVLGGMWCGDVVALNGSVLISLAVLLFPLPD